MFQFKRAINETRHLFSHALFFNTIKNNYV